MPKHVSCCVPLYTNNFRNSSHLSFYRIPKEKNIRRDYVRLLRNDSLKLESESTRLCSAHWTGGKKLSKNHLPLVFPWTKKRNERRILSRTQESKGKKKEFDGTSADMDEDSILVECTLNTRSFCDAETQTEINGEQIDRIQAAIQEVGEEKEELEKEREKLKEESKKLRLITENQKFDITKFKEKDEDIEFYTGLPHWDALMLLYNMVSDKAQNLNYGSYEKKAIGVEQNLGRPRAMSTFEEFILTLMRLRLGLLQKDLSHRFNVSEATVSSVFNTWVCFMRAEL